ncbi:MAG: FAD:protein FMN transferase [Gemmatimonadota bacterium]|jgi:thiamine biosynthesis lipoprotein
MSETCSSTPPGAGLVDTLAGLGFEPVGSNRRVEATLRVGADVFRASGSAASMRTRVSIITIHRSRQQAEEAIGRAFEEMERVVPLLNRHDSASALSTLNERGLLVDPPRPLREVLREAERVHRITRGAFDPTVKPLVDLLRLRGLQGERLPDGSDLAEARALVDMSALRVAERTVRLEKAEMGVTLDGIAKGYVVDRMAAVLLDHGVRDWLVEAGGDIRVAGRGIGGRPWRIGVQDPAGGAYPDVTELREGAIATSGGYEDFFSADRTVHHIVDASTATSPYHTASATVTAPTAMLADALATAAVVLAPDRALAFIETLPRCTCLLLDSDGRARPSGRWRTVARPNH